MTRTTDALEVRFTRFVAGLSYAELVDKLPMTDVQTRAKKVDFFFNNRSIVCEMKSLTADVSAKIDRILEPHRERPEFPGFYGKWPIDAVLERLPDGKDIHKQMYEALTSGIADLVAEANRQIRQTKAAFELPSAHGILLILNDSVAILNPQMIAHRVYKTLIKRTADGQIRYQDVGAILIISEGHRVRLHEQLTAIPILILPHPLVPDEEALNFLSELQKPWAAFEGVPLVEHAESAYDGLEYIDAKDVPSEAERITLGELWKREYRDGPYLSNITDDDLVFYGARLSVEMTIIQKSSTVTRFAILRSTRRWADLNEELNRRHIDVWTVRRLAREEGMHFDESAEFWGQTRLLADDCDVCIDL